MTGDSDGVPRRNSYVGTADSARNESEKLKRDNTFARGMRHASIIVFLFDSPRTMLPFGEHIGVHTQAYSIMNFERK